MIEQQ